MRDARKDLPPPERPPSAERQIEPTGTPAVVPAIGLILLAVIVIALVLFGGWVAFGFAVALTIGGILVLSRYVQRVAWTRRSPRNIRRGLTGMNEDFAITDEAHEDLSVHDLPPGSPGRKEVGRRSGEIERHRLDRSTRRVFARRRPAHRSSHTK